MIMKILLLCFITSLTIFTTTAFSASQVSTTSENYLNVKFSKNVVDPESGPVSIHNFFGKDVLKVYAFWSNNNIHSGHGYYFELYDKFDDLIISDSFTVDSHDKYSYAWIIMDFWDEGEYQFELYSLKDKTIKIGNGIFIIQ